MTDSLFSFKPPWLAHRGASASAPENTMAAFQAAKEQGARWLEFDVMLAACGEAVIFHDETLERTTNGKGYLHEYPYDDLKTLDAGSWFHPRFAGEKIPRLGEVLSFLEKEGLSANIEVKAWPGQEKQTVETILNSVAAHPKMPQPLFSSFSTVALKELRLQAPSAPLGWLMSAWEADWEVQYQALRCFSLNLHHSLLKDPALVADLKTKISCLLAYTINDPSQAKTLLSWGVDALFTDCPEKLLSFDPSL